MARITATWNGITVERPAGYGGIGKVLLVSVASVALKRFTDKGTTMRRGLRALEQTVYYLVSSAPDDMSPGRRAAYMERVQEAQDAVVKARTKLIMHETDISTVIDRAQKVRDADEEARSKALLRELDSSSRKSVQNGDSALDAWAEFNRNRPKA